MNFFFRPLLASPKRRHFLIRLTIRLLDSILDSETSDLLRFSDELDRLLPPDSAFSSNCYFLIEDAYLSCEYSVDILDSVINDLSSLS